MKLLYHGSNQIVDQPLLLAGRRHLDFGQGFYLTSSPEQAAKWAQLVARRRNVGRPTISVFEFDKERIATLKILLFDRPSGAWLDFVVANRKDLSGIRRYDLVIGPVANDNTLPVIDDYMDGKYTKKEAIRRLLPQKLADQAAFLTTKSLELLSFHHSEILPRFQTPEC